MTETLPTPAGTDASCAPAEATTAPQQRQGRQGGRGRTQAKPQAQARAPREVHPVLKQLFDLYPKLFGAHFLPLKLGVFQDLMALHPEVFKRDELKVAMGLHARSTRYLEAVASGLPRHDLNGEAVEPVAPEHVHHAIMEVFRRRQARSSQDLRPYARAQLIEAIEASGLNREDYLLCIRQQDDVSVALLDDAFAVLAEQAAKRDALRKMFEASGKTVAEFADMYGMDPDEVARTLERSRMAQAAPSAPAQAPAAEPAGAEAGIQEAEAASPAETAVEPVPAGTPEAAENHPAPQAG
jgi:ProP effector